MKSKMGILFHTPIPEILAVMIDNGPMNAVQIGDMIGIDNSSILRTLKLLQRRGYADRPEHTRQWHLTASGSEAAVHIVSCMDAMERIE